MTAELMTDENNLCWFADNMSLSAANLF